MTIGEQLREIRDSLNLTQTQMCAGVVTESFYSRVENGKSEINIDDLLAILKQNHVSVRDFLVCLISQCNAKFNIVVFDRPLIIAM